VKYNTTAPDKQQKSPNKKLELSSIFNGIALTRFLQNGQTVTAFGNNVPCRDGIQSAVFNFLGEKVDCLGTAVFQRCVFTMQKIGAVF
jgi:hypothetical protein